MDRCHPHFSHLIDDAHLPEAAKDKFLCNLKHQAAFNYKGLRLLWLLTNLRSGRFKELAAVEKREDLENLFYLLKHKDEGRMRELWYLFFEGRLPQEREKYYFPREMLHALIEAAKAEKHGIIKELIWGFLLSKENHLKEITTPDELVFGLWLDNPIIRNNIIRFLIRDFNPDSVVRAIVTYTVKTGEKIPGATFKQMTRLMEGEERFKQKRDILAGILKGSKGTDQEVDRIWPDFLKGMTRFDLVKLFSENGSKPRWIEDLKEGASQLSFGLKPRENIRDYGHPFYVRAHAILNESHQD